METLETLAKMRRTLASMNAQLTPYSGKRQHQRYLESMMHYQRILNSYACLANEELDRSIRKSAAILQCYTAENTTNHLDG